MEEIAGSFFDNYEEGFLEYLEVHKAQALKDREDYQTLNKKISELNPMFRDLIDELYPLEKEDSIIKSWRNHYNQKSDIFIKRHYYQFVNI